MTRRLVLSYVIVTAFALALLAIPLGITFAHHERDRFLARMEADADSTASLVSYPIDAAQPIPSRNIYDYARRTKSHVIVVDEAGRALVDTAYPQPGRNYSNQPEIQQALVGRRLEGRRHSDTGGTTLLYAAVPTSAKGRVNGAVRITYPAAALDHRVRRVWGALALLCLGVLAAAALVGFALARSIVRPVRRLEDATAQFAAGELTVRVDDTQGAPELRHLATTFNRMAEQLTRLLDSQERFVADASHQLRTPLTALRLRLENLDARLPDENHEEVDAASDEVARMSRLVDGLLLLAREDGERHGRVPVDVAGVARDRSAVWSDVAAERDVTLRVTAPDTAWALAVPGTVEQLVDNLLDNAFDATPAAAPIDIRVDRGPDAIVLHVMDRGRGMDAVARTRAFDRFWRAPGAPSGGSGLGLPIVRGLAEASGGEARLDERPGGGTDAVVVLPMAAAPGDKAVPDAPASLAGR